MSTEVAMLDNLTVVRNELIVPILREKYKSSNLIISFSTQQKRGNVT
jgi:hypothetical protein